MIDKLKIKFKNCDLTYTMDVPVDGESIAYNIADAFIRIIKESDVNPDLVIEDLIEEFGYEPQGDEVSE